MREIYRKRGRTVRYEAGHLVRIAEAGMAIEEERWFECRPLREEPDVPEPDAAAVLETARQIEALAAAHPLLVERLILSEGTAAHEVDDRRWTETFRRVHVALTSAGLRALFDAADFDLAQLRRIAEALPRAGHRREAPQRVRLTPNVAAALLPALLEIMPPNVTLVQSAGGVDGRGLPIEETRLAAPPWPNWYRPSYRVRPIRAPLNMRAECGVTSIDEQLPEAIAILGPVTGLLFDVLCVDRGEVYPATVRVSRIDAVSTDATWFPYGAGSFGASMML